MSAPKPTKKQIAVISMVTAIFLIGAYWTTKWSYHYTSATQFCISCHEMVEPYQQYKDSSHYNNESGVIAECADCHLPPGTVNKWCVKIKQGVKDSIAHAFLDPNDIDHEKWKQDAIKNIKAESCLACHKKLLSPELSKGGFIAHRTFLRGEVETTCLQCHENLVHVNRRDDL